MIPTSQNYDKLRNSYLSFQFKKITHFPLKDQTFKGWNSFVSHHFEIFILFLANMTRKTVGILTFVDEKAVPSLKS